MLTFSHCAYLRKNKGKHGGKVFLLIILIRILCQVEFDVSECVLVFGISSEMLLSQTFFMLMCKIGKIDVIDSCGEGRGVKDFFLRDIIKKFLSYKKYPKNNSLHFIR